MNFIVKEEGFNKEKIELLGSKLSIGNGYLGYRGTLDEFTNKELTACTLSEIFDDSGSGWREPINAPNGLFTKIYCKGEELTVLSSKIEKHSQLVDIKSSVHKRETTFVTSKGNKVKVTSEKFASIDNNHILAMKYKVVTENDEDILIETGIDGDVWDINGPHLEKYEIGSNENCIYINSETHELAAKIGIAEAIKHSFSNEEIESGDKSIIRKIKFTAKANVEYGFEKVVSIYKDGDATGNTYELAENSSIESINIGYDNLLKIHSEKWGNRWEECDVVINGDDKADLALRYSLYLLLSSSPFHSEKVAVPARGLSGQVYKGAMFWDTEMYMLDFFSYEFPDLARNLVKYRINNLDGARKKAQEYGYKGAFYPWECQDDGEEKCTHYNLTDIFTGRPMRTYFRDKQIHISADVVFGIWKYVKITGDEELILDGGAEVILECARFFYSYSYFKKEKNRYEMLDVTGADEYHERVNNNAYTNSMVKLNLEYAIEIAEILEDKYPEKYKELIEKLDYVDDIENIRHMRDHIYVPVPDKETNVIEQFDGYFGLEDITPDKLKEREIRPNEYWGSPCGLSVNTQVLKQSDVVLQLTALGKYYSEEVKRDNLLYYAPRTEHGSSTSPAIYAVLAAQIGELDYAYELFMRAATIDIEGNYRLYLGDLYIGGTHPAANGGSWMAAVLGFGGLESKENEICINPNIPKHWNGLSYNFTWKTQKFRVNITNTEIEVISDKNNSLDCKFNILNKNVICSVGEKINVPMNKF